MFYCCFVFSAVQFWTTSLLCNESLSHTQPLVNRIVSPDTFVLHREHSVLQIQTVLLLILTPDMAINVYQCAGSITDKTMTLSSVGETRILHERPQLGLKKKNKTKFWQICVDKFRWIHLFRLCLNPFEKSCGKKYGSFTYFCKS